MSQKLLQERKLIRQI